jgi:hypothetical protein
MICAVCGNERETSPALCPFCGQTGEADIPAHPRRFSRRTVNLEAGMPVVETALRRLAAAIDQALADRIAVLTVIHGYGSSGKGGAIKSECRKMLEDLQRQGRISEFIAGEDFTRKSGRVKALLHRFPALARDGNLNRGNKGITLVILAVTVAVP